MIGNNIGAAAATPAAPVPTPMQFYAILRSFFKVCHVDVTWTIHAVRWSTNAACNTDAGLRC